MSRLWTGSENNPFADRTVLVACQSPWVEPLTKTIREEAGQPLIVKKMEEVFPILQFGQPEWFILSEGFDADPSQSNPLLEYLQNMPTGQRREIFLVWIGTNIKSGDILSAFSYSVNLVIHPDQLSEIAKQIKKSWLMWRDLYQVFVQIRLRTTGY
ncbi:MAG: hypothetical protein A2Y79_00465 [Deltaproteobacteria bacterium RBG_13_43_22]|nr:MAG: hypothetical protein A2Y79_00465 [Deltaproteobacteria bacterium RBG_13_43_22]